MGLTHRLLESAMGSFAAHLGNQLDNLKVAHKTLEERAESLEKCVQSLRSALSQAKGIVADSGSENAKLYQLTIDVLKLSEDFKQANFQFPK